MMRCGWIFIGLPVLLQAQWGSYGVRSLTSDLRATAVGDVVTILVVEDAQASNAAQTGEQRGSTLGLGAEGSFGSHSGRVSGSFRSDAQFRGKGETSRSERIRARLTARVVAVDSLGHLVLEGRRTTRINGELQTIVLRGKVRPAAATVQDVAAALNLLGVSPRDLIAILQALKEAGALTGELIVQ